MKEEVARKDAETEIAKLARSHSERIAQLRGVVEEKNEELAAMVDERKGMATTIRHQKLAAKAMVILHLSTTPPAPSSPPSPTSLT